MSARRRSGPKSAPARRGTPERRDKIVEMWKAVPEPAPPEPIRRAADPTAVLRSLGPPPLPGQGPTAEQELARVALRASQLATGLAQHTGLLLPDSDDD